MRRSLLAEIAGAAERDRTGMTENLPLSLRRLDRGAGFSQSTSWLSARRPSTRSNAKA